MAEEGDVGVGNIVVTDASVSAVAYVVLGVKVLFIEIPASAIIGGVLVGSPSFGRDELL